MQTFIFNKNISANGMLKEMGIETIEREGKNFLKHGDKEIPRPRAFDLEQVLRDRLGIDIKYIPDSQMIKITTGHGYDYYKGWDKKDKPFYNLVPEGQPAPNGGYAKEYILGIKKAPDLY